MKTSKQPDQFKLLPDNAPDKEVKIGGTIRLTGDHARLWSALRSYHLTLKPSVTQLMQGMIETGLETWGKTKGLL